MAGRRSDHPTELELAILGIVWRRGPSTVREIRDALASTRDLAFTTVSTVLAIMVKKKLLTFERRRKSEGGSVYRPRVRKAATSNKFLRWIAQHIYGGSVAQVVQALADDGKIDAKELAELRGILQREEGHDK